MIILDYSDLISPLPLELVNVGSIHSPTLREIWDISYFTYANYISHLNMDIEEFYKTYKKGIKLSDKKLLNTTKFDLVLENENFRNVILEALNFFFVETFYWNADFKAFISQGNADPQHIGIINQYNYTDVVSIILQKVHIKNDDDDIDLSRVKNKRAKRIYEKARIGRRKLNKTKAKSNLDMTIPNIISSIVSRHKSLNWTNIWEITIYQLFDTFEKLQLDDQYEFFARQVSIWGDKDKSFKFGIWNTNLYDTSKNRNIVNKDNTD